MFNILKIAISVPLHQYFEYLAPTDFPLQQLRKGLRVLVPFGKQEKIGFLMEVSESSIWPKFQLKQALAVLDEVPLLPDSIQQLLEWTSRYYHCPIGEVFANALPHFLRRGKDLKKKLNHSSKKTKEINKEAIVSTLSKAQNLMNLIQLNSHQQRAIESIINSLGKFQTFLLNGVTGSGKTEVYLEVIQAVLDRGEQALVLVPEIGLTPQMLARFQNRFSVPLVLFHSKLTDNQRLENWLLSKTGRASIIIGTRSALFTPLLCPGVIIIDEEHDSSFKQQKGLRYHARDLALVRGRLENIPVVLGSATASLESIFNTTQKRYQILHLPNRAGSAIPPTFRFIDLRYQKLDQGFAPELLQTMKKHLQNQGQVLLFLNRRGFSPVTICHDCGWTAACQRCERKMNFHKKPAHLQCHYCGYRRPLDTCCPACQGQLLTLGQGTQRLEQTLQKYFPSIGIARIDRDNTQRKGSLDKLLKNIHEGESQILIGTQMLAKGHHFPNVTLVGILEADSGLFSADFRALERTGQLLTQVAGRSGRADKPGEVLIQTYYPEHPLLTHLLEQGYLSFSKALLQERQASLLPPYSFFALIHAEALTSIYPFEFLNEVKKKAGLYGKEEINLLGPVPSLLPRRAGYYRCQLLLQTKKRNALQHLLEQIIKPISLLASSRRVRWSLDVDPIELF